MARCHLYFILFETYLKCRSYIFDLFRARYARVLKRHRRRWKKERGIIEHKAKKKQHSKLQEIVENGVGVPLTYRLKKTMFQLVS